MRGPKTHAGQIGDSIHDGMHMVTATEAQRQRLRLLGADASLETRVFNSIQERDADFRALEGRLTDDERRRLQAIPGHHRRPALCRIEGILTDKLVAEGSVQVVTPIMMTRMFLEKMSITDKHPLTDQVFWLDRKNCLRPMLVPNLYCLLRRLVRLWKKPIRTGQTHLNLNE